MKILFYTFLMTATLLASETVTLGSLEWQDNKQAKTTKLNWQNAKEYCQNLSLAGHNDWQLPTIKELQSIVDISRIKPAIKRSFKYTASSYTWSSSQNASSAKYAWVVNFGDGGTSYDSKSNEYYVRCVRHRQ